MQPFYNYNTNWNSPINELNTFESFQFIGILFELLIHLPNFHAQIFWIDLQPFYNINSNWNSPINEWNTELDWNCMAPFHFWLNGRTLCRFRVVWMQHQCEWFDPCDQHRTQLKFRWGKGGTDALVKICWQTANSIETQWNGPNNKNNGNEITMRPGQKQRNNYKITLVLGDCWVILRVRSTVVSSASFTWAGFVCQVVGSSRLPTLNPPLTTLQRVDRD